MIGWRLELRRKCTSFGALFYYCWFFDKKSMWLLYNYLSTVAVSSSMCENLWNSGPLRQETLCKVNMPFDTFIVL